MGNALIALGMEMENRVVLILPDSSAFVASFLGAIKIGAVPVPLNPSLSPRDYAFYLNDSRAKVVIADASIAVPLVEMQAQLPFLRHLVVVDPGDLSDHPSLHASFAPFQQTPFSASPRVPEFIPFAALLSGGGGHPGAG